MVVRLTLVSASPRRAELLRQLKIPFDILPSEAAETWHGFSASEVVVENAIRKVKRSAVFGDRFRLLLGADTLISFEGRLLGKPQGVDAARRMLGLLSGSQHSVWTGICLAGVDTGDNEIKTVWRGVESTVEFAELSSEVLRDYLKSREWEGKAGAYAIQGLAASFARTIQGTLDNVIGLPVDQVNEILRDEFGHLELR